MLTSANTAKINLSRKVRLAFVACFSRAGRVRPKSYQNEELLLAVDQFRQRAPGQPWLIPVRFDDCDVPDLDLGAGRTLGSLQRVGGMTFMPEPPRRHDVTITVDLEVATFEPGRSRRGGTAGRRQYNIYRFRGHRTNMVFRVPPGTTLEPS